MSEFDPHEKAREYQREGVSLMFAIPVALLAFSVNKDGQIGWCPVWMGITWVAWFVLIFATLVSAFRLWLVPATFQRFGAAEFATWEKWNGRVFLAQVVSTSLGFLLLCTAHLAHSIYEEPLRQVRVKETEIEIQEKWIDLRAREETARSKITPPALPAPSAK